MTHEIKLSNGSIIALEERYHSKEFGVVLDVIAVEDGMEGRSPADGFMLGFFYNDGFVPFASGSGGYMDSFSGLDFMEAQKK